MPLDAPACACGDDGDAIRFLAWLRWRTDSWNLLARLAEDHVADIIEPVHGEWRARGARLVLW
jgi:hypothetical protein